MKATTAKLTTRGLALLAIALAGVVAGIVMRDPLATRLGLAFLLLLPAARVLCLWNIRGLRFSRIVPDCVIANDDFRATVSLENTKRWLTSRAIELEDSALPFWRKGILVRRLGPGEIADFSEETRIVSRGEYRRKSYTLRSTFPCGLFKVTVKRRARLGILVFPRPELPKRLRHDIQSNQFEGESRARTVRDYTGEFLGIREYRPGDRMKAVHWPATARARSLMVRERDRPLPEKFSVIFHTFIPPGRPILCGGFDHSMELLSGLFFHCRQCQIPIHFTASFNDWNALEHDDPSELRPVMAMLARAEPKIEHSAQPLIDAIRSIPGHHRIYVISNTPLEHWEDVLPDLPHPVTCLDNKQLRVRRPRLRFVRQMAAPGGAGGPGEIRQVPVARMPGGREGRGV